MVVRLISTPVGFLVLRFPHWEEADGWAVIRKRAASPVTRGWGGSMGRVSGGVGVGWREKGWEVDDLWAFSVESDED